MVSHRAPFSLHGPWNFIDGSEGSMGVLNSWLVDGWTVRVSCVVRPSIVLCCKGREICALLNVTVPLLWCSLIECHAVSHMFSATCLCSLLFALWYSDCSCTVFMADTHSLLWWCRECIYFFSYSFSALIPVIPFPLARAHVCVCSNVQSNMS